jgi:tetratricopeptide (TPR) repeat protein
VEGVYLSGYGVVFTTTLPTALRETRPGDDQPAPKALSDWERAQMELRGERPEPAGSSDSRPPSIRDVLLRVLADNGRHLTHLRENEKVAIVVTFRNSGGSWTQTTPFTALNPGAISVPHNIGRGWGMPAENSLVPSPSTDATTPAPTTARDYEILADLHLKQQQFQAAFDAYAKAIAAVDAEAKAGGGQPKDLSSLYARQAQALLGLGRIDAAKEALKKSEESKPIKPATPATREQRSTHVPARLIVSATKRQLDQVGQGQLSFEDFRKAAVIEVQ